MAQVISSYSDYDTFCVVYAHNNRFFSTIQLNQSGRWRVFNRPLGPHECDGSLKMKRDGVNWVNFSNGEYLDLRKMEQ